MRTSKQESYRENPKPNLLIPTNPRTIHKVKCKKCGDEFKTRYAKQIYCRNPCKSEHELKGKPVAAKVTLSKSEISKKNADRRIELEQERTDFTLLQRKLFSRRM